MIKQNIYLFYEQDDNDDGRKIDTKLVRLYMNRFIIDEDHQNEIVGVADLTKIEKACYHREMHPEFTSYETVPRELIHKIDFDIWTRWMKIRKTKLKNDMEIINAALNTLKKFDNPAGDFHFIIGSWYYMSIYTKHWFPEKDGKRPMMYFDHDQFIGKDKKPIEDLLAHAINQLSIFNFEGSFTCTFLCGINFALCKQSEVRRAYRPAYPSINRTIIEEPYKSIVCVNDDLEEFFQRMMVADIFTKLSRKFHGNEYKELFLFQYKDDFKEIAYLNELKYGDSYSVGFSPSITEEHRDFPIHSVLFNCEVKNSKAIPFFPPIRHPQRLS